jgi:carbohydrate diacid regulator
MISNQILQSAVEGLKNITRRELSVIERAGVVAASVEENKIGTTLDGVDLFISSQAESQLIQGRQYFKVFDNGVCEYIIGIEGEDEEAYRVGKIAAFHVQSLLVAYKERYDKDNFIKNLLLDNLLLVDIYSRAKKLGVENGARRLVYLIETDLDKDSVEIVRNLFPSKGKDFVTTVDENNIILVKELREKDGPEQIENIARQISDTLSAESLSNVYVAVGTPVTDLKNVSNSYKEAKMALEVGNIFETERNIVSYEKLGVGRLIYQLPLTLCKMFISEVLGSISIESFDEELLNTVNKFFENNLNVSETSRQLYIHRNTLVYRLDKLQKLADLDLRKFDDAIIFKITLMVYKYMTYKEKFLF